MTDKAMMFDGREAVSVYAMTALASALKLYARTGLKVNRAYTPKAMLEAASRYTGQTFKRGQYMEASDALRAKAQEVAAGLKVTETDHSVTFSSEG